MWLCSHTDSSKNAFAQQKSDAKAGNLVVNKEHWNRGWMSALLPERCFFPLSLNILLALYMLILNWKITCIWRNCWGDQLLINRWPKAHTSHVQPCTENHRGAAADPYLFFPLPKETRCFYFVETKWISARGTWNTEWPDAGYFTAVICRQC